MNKGKQIQIPENYIISSSTDPKGIITSVSPDFCRISGCKPEDFIGKPHNIVRHPETPKELFADKWNSLKRGNPWKGFIKNQTPNGDYYWVSANVSPTFENGQIVGYISVRRPATAEQARQGQFIYDELNSGRQKIVNGYLTPKRPKLADRLSIFNYLRLSVANKFLVVFLPMLLMSLILAGLMIKNNFQFKSSYDLSNAQMEMVSLASQLTHEAQKERGMSAGFLGSKGKSFAVELGQQRKEFDEKNQALQQLLQTQPGLVTSDLASLIKQVNQQIAVVVKNRSAIDKLDIKPAVAIDAYSLLAQLLIKISGQLSHDSLDLEISNQLNALHSFEQIKENAGIERAVLSNAFAANSFAPGFYERFVTLVSNQETYRQIFATYTTKQMLNKLQELEKSPTFATTQNYREVVFAKNLGGNFNQVSTEWFAAQTTKIDMLNELVLELNQQILESTKLKSSEQSFNFWLTLVLVTLAIFLSVYLGLQVFKSVVGTLRQINRVVSEINESGRLADRVNIKDTGDELTDIANAFDNMIGTMERSIFAVSEVMDQIALGEFEHRVTDRLVGDMNTLKNGVNNAAQSVQNTMSALHDVMEGLANGDFSVRMDDRVPENLRTAVNNTLAGMDQAIEATSDVMNRLSQGEVSQRINLDLKGSFRSLADNTNSSLEKLQSAIVEINQVASGLATGNLTIQANTELGGELEELRKAINSAVASLATTMMDIQMATSEVSMAANEVTSGTQSLNDRTQQQAASLEQTSASMEEITSLVANTSNHANEAREMADEVKNKSEDGAKVMQQTIIAMQDISEASEKINNIVGLIDSIAFQTNLLALNAAVEAARAGDHGRGFAVVASEVRSLAQKSAEAANDIKQLITQTSEQIANGSELVSASGKALDEINLGIESVNKLVAEIAQAADDQSQGISQVNLAINEIDSMTQQNAALVEETTANTETLSNNSQKMQQAVARFQLNQRLN